jgi:hypothetical protein
MIRRLVILFVMIALLWPVAALAQDSSDITEDDDILMRINGPLTIAAGDLVDVLVVINDNATVDGTVDKLVMVINGTATINGTVDGDLVVVSGDLVLGPSAVVDDVHLYDSTITRDPAATVRGDISEDAELNWSWWGSAIFTLWIWVGMTIVVLVAGLLFALFGGRQLRALAETAKSQVAMSILTAVVLMFGLPILGILVLFTVIGIPLGLAIIFVLIPLLWLLGYIIIGAHLGIWLRARMGQTDPRTGLVWATLIGLLILQLIGLIPFIGGLIGFLAGTYGAGVLVLHLIRGRGKPSDIHTQNGTLTPPISTSITGD